MKNKKVRWCTISACLLCFIVGGIFGYFLAGYTVNSAHSANYELSCPDGSAPDDNGCCAGEVYTDMADLGFNCCPDDGGNCYPPIK